MEISVIDIMNWPKGGARESRFLEIHRDKWLLTAVLF